MKKVVLITILMPFLVSMSASAQVSTGDIIISEIMADPNPVIGLPDAEYVEIYNRTAQPVNLEKWKFETAIFPSVTVDPGEYVILCRQADTVLFKPYGKVTGLKSYPAINDGGKILCLYDNTGRLVHGVEYSPGWYGNTLKDDGGWSLEIIDVEYPFYGEGNWKASNSSAGGTPGKANSVSGRNPDTFFFGILNAFPVDSLHLTVTFSEPVSASTDLQELVMEGNNVAGIITEDPLLRRFTFALENILQAGKIERIIIPELEDFAGNNASRNSFEFGLPENASEGDLLFNEILFNPWPGYPDFIEFYNNSKKILDASRLQIASVNEDSGDTSRLYIISGESRCILPGKYFTITTDLQMLIEKYDHADPDALFETGSLPSMPDDGGTLLLFNMQLEIIDQVRYDEKMHYPLLSGFEGISLEKISPSLNSLEASGWHSAAGSSGWATPGAPNSVYDSAPESSAAISLSSTKISPDSDGFEDILTIHLNIEGLSNVVTATVFDESGSFITKICDNLLTGPDSAVIWDGTAGDGTEVRSGIYIILVTWFNETGKTGRWKGVCAVVE